MGFVRLRRVGDLVDGQRHAVDGDRALGREEWRERGIDRDADALRIAFVADADDPAGAIDMAGDDMAAEFVADLQRAFEVQAAASGPHALRGAGDGFAGNVDREPVAAPLSTTVRQTPEQAIEAPSSTVAVS